MIYSTVRSFRISFILFLFAALTLRGQPEPGGTISGQVLFDGRPPKPRVVTVAQDREVCGAKVGKEDLIVNNGGIQNAVVSITSVGQTTEEFTLDKAVFDQRGCRFVPHVLVMAPGNVTFLNSDGILHNVHVHGKKNPPRNEAMPRIRRRLIMELNEPEIIPIRCDAHPWMSAYAVVAEHPYYAVTDESGSFTLDKVPPGDHIIDVWHEVLGRTTQEVTVDPGETAKVVFTFSRAE